MEGEAGRKLEKTLSFALPSVMSSGFFRGILNFEKVTSKIFFRDVSLLIVQNNFNPILFICTIIPLKLRSQDR